MSFLSGLAAGIVGTIVAIVGAGFLSLWRGLKRDYYGSITPVPKPPRR